MAKKDMKSKTPWLVKERDLRRYLGRAVRACMSGRVVFFYNNQRKSGGKRLLGLSPHPGWETASQAALVSFKRGKYREVVLADLPPRKKR